MDIKEKSVIDVPAAHFAEMCLIPTVKTICVLGKQSWTTTRELLHIPHMIRLMNLEETSGKGSECDCGKQYPPSSGFIKLS